MINCNIIQTLWDIVLLYGIKVRLLKFDGSEKWNILKNIFVKYDMQIEWLPSSLERYEQMMNRFNIKDDIINMPLPENYDDYTKWQVTYFFFQHGRIPFKNKNNPTFMCLIQIAYNAGLLFIEKYNKYNTDERIKYYDMNKLNSYAAYISSDMENKINQMLCKNPQIISEIQNISNELENEKIKMEKKKEIESQLGGYDKYKCKYKKYKYKYIKIARKSIKKYT